MAHLRIYLPLPRLHVYETLQLPQLTLTPPQYDVERPKTPLAKEQKQLRAAVSSASDIACICFPEETLVLRDGAEENNLAQAPVGPSGVAENDFLQHTVLEMPFESASLQLRRPTRKSDQKAIVEALEHADAALDGIRFDYCRLDVPRMSLGPPGYLPDKSMFAVYFHDTELNQGRMIRYEPANPLSMPGCGLDLEGPIQPSPVDALICNTHRPATLGVRLRRMLRMFCQSFVAPSDESKILTNLFAMDGCLTPETSTSGDFKKFVAISAAGGPSGYEAEYATFRQFYQEVRNPLVHHGKTYGQLGRNRRDDLFYLQGLIFRVLENLTKSATEDFKTYWQNAITMANQHA
ncbi:MAG TPA: hypothetical protein VMY37_01715 [Thermoguttaceae bacterium]|nr:hypothetical protein [Thermoguttaceae bacterium]